MDTEGTRLAELTLRHTRRHMPTRRVALEASYLPTAGGAAGSDLLAAVVAEFAHRIDAETRVRVPRLLRSAADGTLEVPSVHLHHRLQTDTHGLDRSRHRLLDDGRGTVLELDVHAHPEPQVLAVCMAIAAMPAVARAPAHDAVRRALRRPGIHPHRWRVVRLIDGLPAERPGLAAPADPSALGMVVDGRWSGVPEDLRWAMETLGLHPGTDADRAEIQRRYRRLVRVAHPDHGGSQDGAADRLARLSEARAILLSLEPN
ncbi:MAG: J domain-containing protein [Actinomycetes bacterium]